MRVLLFGFGSRGDVQPFIALGKGLQAAGYEVAVAAGINFKDWIEREGLGYETIHVDVEAFMNTDIGKEWLGASSHNPQQELKNMRAMTNAIASDVTDDILAMLERHEVFVSGVLTVEAMGAAADKLGKKHVLGLMSPFAPTRSGAAGMQALIQRGNSPLNWLWGYVIEAMMFTVLRAPSDGVRSRLGMRKSTPADFMRAWNRTPTLFGVSPLVVPPPPDWGPQIHTTGYWFLNASDDWQPSPALANFLAAGEKPVYIGFGSMSNRDPEGTLRLLLDGLAKSGQRGVIHSGWAGLKADQLPPNVFMLDTVPHDWLFPRMAAVVHHGGAGTTGAALRAGVPSLIVPHIGDQPYWGRRVRELGVGAAPIPRHKLTSENLAAAIREMVGDKAMRQRAAALGEGIRKEDGIGNAVRAFREIVG